MEILTTTDYDQFKYFVSNREVDKTHVRKLVASIEQKNLMYIRPAIVTDEMYVIDGQHRIEACRLLNVPVYYIVTEGLTKADIAILNTAQKNWTRLDFINFYAIEGKQEYMTFSKLVNRFPFMRVSCLLELVGDHRKTKIREGILDVKNLERATQVCEWLGSFVAKRIEYAPTREFVRAFSMTIKDEESFRVLLSQARWITKCSSRAEYENQFKALLNKGNVIKLNPIL